MLDQYSKSGSPLLFDLAMENKIKSWKNIKKSWTNKNKAKNWSQVMR